MGNTVAPQQILQAILSRIHGAQSSIPGMPSTPPMFPGQIPSGGPSGPAQVPIGMPTPPQGGAKPPAFVGNAPQTNQSVGDFATHGAAVNAGLTQLGSTMSSMVNKYEEREHNKKAALAENYMLQINSLLASGDPRDKEKASMILEDPKIRKILKTGLEYVPLEEEVPPEAQGVHTALQKLNSQSQGQRRPILPQPSQQQMLAQQLMQAQIAQQQQATATSKSEQGVHEATAADTKAKTAGLPSADEAREARRVEASSYKAQADEAEQRAAKLKQDMKQAEKDAPLQTAVLRAQIAQANADAAYKNAQAKYEGGRIPAKQMQDLFKDASVNLNKLLSIAVAKSNKRFAAGIRDESQEVKGLKAATQYLSTTGRDGVMMGTMTSKEAIDAAYALAGLQSAGAGAPSSIDDEIMKAIK